MAQAPATTGKDARGAGPPHARASTCRNCGAAVSSKFCPDCGQDTSLHPLSVWEFIHEIVSHYVAAEGKLWRTLALLALQPGRLTLEYLAGRRQRYIVPLRLYLTASFLFFALAQISGHIGTPGAAEHADAKGPPLIVVHPSAVLPGRTSPDSPNAVEIVEAGKAARDAMASADFAACLAPQAPCPLLKRLIAPAIVKIQQDPRGMSEQLSERFRHSLSYAMFLLLPIFALLLALVYRKRGLYYGEHLVFALHVHSFWFFLAILTVVLPDAISDWLPLCFVVYGFWALQRVYGGRWWATLLRGLTVTTLYAVVMGLGAAGLSIALLATT